MPAEPGEGHRDRRAGGVGRVRGRDVRILDHAARHRQDAAAGAVRSAGRGVRGGGGGAVRHTFWSTAAELYREHGALGFFRGVRPRMTSVSIWGTTMVTTYEFLKRTSKIDDAEP